MTGSTPGEALEEVVLCTVIGEIHARLLLDALATQGIPARAASAWPFDGDLLRVPAPLGSYASARMRIYVFRRDLARARQVWEDFEVTGVQTANEEAPPEDDH
jgi:hypothetical protein